MTTPASNVDDLVQISGTVSFNGAPPSRPKYYQGVQRSIRPASQTNRVNADGIRPERGWVHRWGHCLMPLTRGTGRLTGSSGSVEWTSVPATQYSQAFLDGKGAAWILGRGLFPQSLRAEARTRLMLKLRDGKAEWGQTMAEAASTAKTLRDVAGGMIGLVDRLARSYRMEKRAVADVLAGRKLRVGKHIPSGAGKDITQAWLTAQFGIKPLLGDIADTNAALDYLLFEEKAIPQMILRAGASSTENTNYTFRGPFSPAWECALRTPLETRLHLSTRWAIPVTNNRRLQQLGLGNPFSVGYEVLPWSWAVDYVSTTGDWLQGLFAREGTTFLGGCESFYMVYGGSSPTSVTVRDGVMRDVKATYPSSTSMELGRFERVILDTSPGPWFPTFRNRMGLNQLANLTSALAQLR